jgi:hypothetical protein
MRLCFGVRLRVRRSLLLLPLQLLQRASDPKLPQLEDLCGLCQGDSAAEYEEIEQAELTLPDGYLLFLTEGARSPTKRHECLLFS